MKNAQDMMLRNKQTNKNTTVETVFIMASDLSLKCE